MLKIGVNGATGRLGRITQELINNSTELIGSKFCSSKSSSSDLEVMIEESDIIVDFSTPKAAKDLLNATVKSTKPAKLVIGTTGLEETHFELMEAIKSKTSVFYSENMSKGMYVLNRLVREAASKLSSKDFDAEIIETHHRAKKDVPSGSALKLATQIAQARGEDYSSRLNCNRNPENPERNEGEIACLSSRIGGASGKHEVSFGSSDELIKLSHEALDKSIFARGALEAAKWLENKPSGLWGMDDLIEYI